MKTFRLCSLTIYVQNENETTCHSIPLEDGLIINKENQSDNWLIEGIIQKDFKQLFDELKEKEEPILVEATITNINNRPASFMATVRDSKYIEDEVQLLLDATRLLRKENHSEIILKCLVEQGISGEELLKEFKRLKKERGPAFQYMIEHELKEMKKKLGNK